MEIEIEKIRANDYWHYLSLLRPLKNRYKLYGMQLKKVVPMDRNNYELIFGPKRKK